MFVIIPGWLARILRILVSPFMVLAGILMVVVGVHGYLESKALAENGRVVQAKVLSELDIGNGKKALQLHYEVDGQTYDTNEPGIDPSLYDGSGVIDVVYDPEYPHAHRIAAAPDNSAGLGTAVGGLVMALFFVFVFFASLRR